MKTQPKFDVQLTSGAALLTFAVAKSLAQLFLLSWDSLSAGHSDIAARDIWILAMWLPGMAGLSVLAAVATATALTRRTERSLFRRLACALAGGGIATLGFLFGFDPTASVLKTVHWPSESLYYVASIIVAGAIGFVGTTLILKAARVSRVDAAAV